MIMTTIGSQTHSDMVSYFDCHCKSVFIGKVKVMFLVYTCMVLWLGFMASDFSRRRLGSGLYPACCHSSRCLRRLHVRAFGAKILR